MAIEQVDAKLTNNLRLTPERRGLKESLKAERNLGKFFSGVQVLASQLYFSIQDQGFMDYRREISQGVNPSKIVAAVENRDLSGTKADTPEFDRLLAAISLKQQIARGLIKEIISGENQLGLSQTERVVLEATCDMGNQFDLFFRMYNRHVSTNPVDKRVQDDPVVAQSVLERSGLERSTYLYVVFEHGKTQNADDVEVVPYAQAFSEPVQEIGNLIDKMSSQLVQSEDPESVGLKNYFEAVKRALSSVDPKEHESLWQAVEVIWLKQVRGRMQPIHMMEAYGENMGKRVVPDLALTFPDDRYPEVRAQIALSKYQVIRYLVDNFPESQSLVASRQALDDSRAELCTGVGSGVRLQLRPVGQNIPNRPESKLHGVKIFIDHDAMDERWKVQRGLLVKLFGEEYVVAKFGDEDLIINSELGEFIAGHEVAHNAFVRSETRVKIGPKIYSEVEEHKATMVLIGSKSQEQNFMVKGQAFAKGLFAEMLRDLNLRGIVMVSPYYNSAVDIVDRLLNVGILHSNNGKWEFDDDTFKIDQFLWQSGEVLGELVEAYENYSTDKAQEFIGQHFQETEGVKQVLATLGKL